MANRSALVTGGTGFVGSHLVRKLSAERWDVHMLVREGQQAQSLRGLPHVTVHQTALTIESVASIMGKVMPQVIFHLAALFVVDHKPEQIVPLIESNVLLGSLLLEAMSMHKVSRMVNVGTAWQNFQDADYSPVCLYAATKQAFEAVLHFYAEARGIQAITLKLFDTYGPEDPRMKLFQVLRKAAASGQVLDFSPGEQTISLVYVDDVVKALLMAAEVYRPQGVQINETYAVNADEAITLRHLLALYAELIGKALNIRWGARPYRDREMMTPWSKGKRLPGWSPRISLAEGIRRMEGLGESK